jgi:hypothetical protein
MGITSMNTPCHCTNQRRRRRRRTHRLYTLHPSVYMKNSSNQMFLPACAKNNNMRHQLKMMKKKRNTTIRFSTP